MHAFVELEPDAIQEEEELIEAVEALVETCAVTVKRSLEEDFHELVRRCKTTMEWLFPIVLEYQQQTRNLWEDLQNLVILLIVFIVVFWILAPNRQQSSHVKNRNTAMRRVRSCESWSEGEESAASSDHRWSAATDDETDEERFEKLWPSISLTQYRKLVLPPTCRLVEKPSHSTTKRGSQSMVMRGGEAQPNDSTRSIPDDSDNPVKRFQTYVSQFLVLFRKILSYDYPGAVWTVWQWLQGIRRRHIMRQQEDDNESVDLRASGNGGILIPPTDASAPPPLSPGKPTVVATYQDEVDTTEDDRARPIMPLHLQMEELMNASATPIDQSLENRRSSDTTIYHDLDPHVGSPLHTKSKKSLLKRLSMRKRESDLSSCVDDLKDTKQSPVEDLSERDLPNLLESRNTTVGSSDPSYYFETARCHESLKQMSIDLPVPDSNGYILGDEFLPDSRYTPLLVFVNSRSGPQQGHLLITQLRRLLNPIQVWDLAHGGPEAVLASFLRFSRLRILVCGGDGTVSWIVSVLEGMNVQRKWPPIAILPLGTGNDLARIHGWGGGYNNESIIGILEQISESYISMLDIWEVTIDSKAKKKETKTFFNYLGVGADAQAALQVHYLRESRPAWFFSRIVNKAWYGVFGAEDIIMASSVNVRKEIKLVADGVEVSLPSDSQGIIIMNIDSYAGGVPLWSHGTPRRSVTVRSLKSPRRSKSMNMLSRRSNSIEHVDSTDDLQILMSDDERIDRVTACDRESSCQDGILEIVSIRGAFHLGQIKVGLSNAQRLCQCREVEITIKNKVAVQVDGEPWRQRPCTLTVRRKKAQAVMLHRSADDGGVETEMSKLLDWAEERQIIDSEVHSIMMKEYSRRIESKTRKRRVKEQDNIMHTLKKAISQTAIGTNLHSSQTWQGGIAF